MLGELAYEAFPLPGPFDRSARDVRHLLATLTPSLFSQVCGY